MLLLAAFLATGPIRLSWPTDLPSPKVHVRSFAVGSFGGAGSDDVADGEDGGMELPSKSVASVPTEVKFIVYVAGCEFATFNVRPVPGEQVEKSFACRPLGTIAFQGTVSGIARPEELTV